MLAEELKALAARERETEAARQACINVCAAASCQALQSEELKKALTRSCGGARLWTGSLHGAAGGLSGPVRRGAAGERGTGRNPLSTSAAIGRRRDRRGAGRPTGRRLSLDSQMPFFTRQHRIVLENSGRIDPDRMEDYIARDGYFALSTVLTRCSRPM